MIRGFAIMRYVHLLLTLTMTLTCKRCGLKTLLSVVDYHLDSCEQAVDLLDVRQVDALFHDGL